MATWVVFDTQVQAQAGLDTLDSNIRNAVAAFTPEAIDQDSIVGRNAATGQLDPTATKTETWDIPRQTVDGKWAWQVFNISHPAFNNINLMSGISNHTIVNTIQWLE